MDKVQFTFTMLAAEDGKSNVLCVTRITTQDDHTYRIPQKYYNALHHEELITTSVYNTIKKTNLKRDQVRKVWIRLTDQLKKAYFDSDDNVQFQNEYLEEIRDNKNVSTSVTEQPLIRLLEQLLEKNQEKSEETNVGKIAKEFTIEKFDGKNSNANQWMAEFEKECERFKVTRNDKKIEILKSFMEKSAADWYSCTLVKLTIQTDWEDWKENFCTTFASKGWSPIRYAMAFRYQAGSLLEYSIKKEKLLLQIRKSIDEGTLIDLIATGLPNYVADRIDREKLKKTEDLHNEIGKLEHLTTKKEIKKGKSNNNPTKIDKPPCKICKDKGKGTRYHSEAECWFKEQENKRNKPQHVNNLTLEVDLSNDDPKN